MPARPRRSAANATPRRAGPDGWRRRAGRRCIWRRLRPAGILAGAVVGAVAMVSPARIAQVSEAAPLDWAGD
ncbi:hypothetical protein CKO45_31160 [Paracraurococcus ruber]|uniref:Uncharacterized protein n=1 Tax=Paracraurococcus ruber TaxID=77675 RepID=A0ABS1D6W4_9PROT|nr:hypothetical protein [Paracraurococcus ruber]